MIGVGESICPKCNGYLRYFDNVRRIVRTKRGVVNWISIRRLICITCGAVHRELPNNLLPNKHYELKIIQGFISGELSSYDLDYEDYPCESTVIQWKKSHRLMINDSSFLT